MSDAPAPAKKTKSAPKKPATHPKYIDMIKEAIENLKERNGSSRQAITKYISANFDVGDNVGVQVKAALKRGVAGGALSQTKGSGASGSFKVTASATKPSKSRTPAAKKPAAKKAAKKPAAKKAKKPAAKKPAAKKPAAKKPAAKKPAKKAAKKPAAKKAAKKPAKKPAKKTAKK